MVDRPGFLDEDDDGRLRLPAVEDLSQAAAETVVELTPPAAPPGFVDTGVDHPSGRIVVGWRPDLMPRRGARSGTLGWIMGGLSLFGATWLLGSAIGLVQGEFHRSLLVAALDVVCLTAALGCLLAGMAAELVAYRRLQRVETLRNLLKQPDAPLTKVQSAASIWVRSCRRRVLDGEAVGARVRAAQNVEEVRGILARDACPALAKAARQAGQRAAIEGGALTAVMPSPVFDGAVAAWRGLRLMREVAVIYGLRPGPLVTLSLMRRVATTAATSSGVTLLSQSLAEHVLHRTPIIKHLVSAIPETSIVAFRLYRMATIVAEACSPVG